jgi:SAM-dependent methyltransferase
MQSVYEYPRYYEIAFSFRDISAEVDTLEQCFEQYAALPVKSILELGSGNSPHMEELLKRGYAYTGLDISAAMLAYSSQKAAALGGQAAFVCADMRAFALGETFDFAFIALGSLAVRDTQDILSHLRSVAHVLHPGGLYLLDWCIHFAPFANQVESWSMEHGPIKVAAQFSEKLIDAVEQLVEERLALEVFDDGLVYHLAETNVTRMIFPQEFLQLIQHTGEFEFVGWWNNWDLARPLGEVKDPQRITRPITLLRRK